MAKRIAQMLYSMGMGGVENFLMNIYRNIDREKYQFDFILQTNERSYFDDEIEKLGGRIFRIPRFEKHPIEHIKELKKILKENEYIAFHRHTASSTVFVDLLVAKECGIKRRIVHSHSTSHRYKALNKFFRPLLYNSATVHLACGKEAGKWLYGNKPFEILNNAIDCHKYFFSNKIRFEYREKLGIDNYIVIGHVGRFDDAKNQRYLIKVFKKLCEKKNNYKLLLCGDGTLRNELEKECKKNNIDDKVVFLGVRKDVNNILQAVDIFAFPSKYEGVSLTLIEAQLSGLPIIMSDKIAKETIYNPNVHMLGISEHDIEIWAEKLIECKGEILSRKDINENLIKDYDVNTIRNRLINEYISL